MMAPPSAPDYDYLIVGAGAAGLSLAYHLAQEPRLASCRVLLLDPDPKNQNDRTWSFWSKAPSPFEAIVAHSWSQLAFRSPGFEQVFRLQHYRYHMIRGLDFYQFVRQILAGRSTFHWQQTTVTALENTPAGVRATTPEGTVTARYAFDSRPPRLHELRQPARHRYLLQHFVGWEIETAEDVFDPATVEFMDFRVAQHQEARFIYVLPFSRRRALVEYTLFSGSVLAPEEYEEGIRTYLRETLGIQDFRQLAVETGAIPMTDHPLPLRTGAHIVHLGTLAGRAKPSTGYAFQRIQAHSAHLVQALAATGHPPARLTTDQAAFKLFDTLLLDIMQRRGEYTRDIFTQLFRRNPLERLLSFLDEQTSPWENFQIMNSVRPWPFLRSIWHVLRRRPGQR